MKMNSGCWLAAGCLVGMVLIPFFLVALGLFATAVVPRFNAAPEAGQHEGDERESQQGDSARSDAR